jgi:hypothetical protein
MVLVDRVVEDGVVEVEVDGTGEKRNERGMWLHLVSLAELGLWVLVRTLVGGEDTDEEVDEVGGAVLVLVVRLVRMQLRLRPKLLLVGDREYDYDDGQCTPLLSNKAVFSC